MIKQSRNGRVIVRFKGGLANQIYQLAAGRQVADALGYRLVYSDVYYRFCMNTRELLAPSVYDEKIERVFETPVNVCVHRFAIRSRFWAFLLGVLGCKSHIIDDAAFPHFIEDISGRKGLDKKASPDLIVLDGYFHLASVLERSEIAKGFRILRKSPIEAIGIHVRLGDYLKPPYKDFYRTVDDTYIRQAYKVLLEEFSLGTSVPIFVYSDSPQEAISMVRSAIPEGLISMAGGYSALSDLRDLSACRYKILANSSYSLLSWHLSTDSCATVPRHWFRTKETDIRQFSRSKRLVLMSSYLERKV